MYIKPGAGGNHGACCPKFTSNLKTRQHRVHTGKFVLNSRTFQGLLKESPVVF